MSENTITCTMLTSVNRISLDRILGKPANVPFSPKSKNTWVCRQHLVLHHHVQLGKMPKPGCRNGNRTEAGNRIG